MDKQVVHYCDCQHCDVEYDIIEVAEGPITPAGHQMSEMIKAIYRDQIKSQVIYDTAWLRRRDWGAD